MSAPLGACVVEEDGREQYIAELFELNDTQAVVERPRGDGTFERVTVDAACVVRRFAAEPPS